MAPLSPSRRVFPGVFHWLSTLNYVLSPVAPLNSAPSPPGEFVEALLSLRDVDFTSHFEVEEVPAPDNIAPFSAAVRAFTLDGDGYHPLGTGRFVILYDPAGQEGWDGNFRLIIHVRAQMDPELGADPLLGEVAWSWVHESLDRAGANVRRLNGTVTRELSETFGGLQLRRSGVEVELRASWSPVTNDLGPHFQAWFGIINQYVGAGEVEEPPTVLTTIAGLKRP